MVGGWRRVPTDALWLVGLFESLDASKERLCSVSIDVDTVVDAGIAVVFSNFYSFMKSRRSVDVDRWIISGLSCDLFVPNICKKETIQWLVKGERGLQISCVYFRA